MSKYHSILVSFVLLLTSLAEQPARAAISEWKDTQGVAFRGEPAEVFGPFALFRTANDGGRRVLLSTLTPEDQLRFAAALPAATPSGSTWSNGPVADDLARGVFVVADKKLVPAAIRARPAPEIVVVFYVSSQIAEFWTTYYNFLPTERRLRAVYGDRFQCVFYGVRTDAVTHRDFAVTMGLPWLITDYGTQANMPTLSAQEPKQGIRAVAFSKSGVPIVTSPVGSVVAVRRFVDELTSILNLHEPNNRRCWADRLQYFNTVRPSLHANESVPPLLIGSPLRDDVLRKKGVTTVSAQIQVGVDGRPTTVALAPDTGIPESLRAAITDGLRRSTVFSPAIEAGRPVVGTYEFRHTVPEVPRCSAADLAWVNGEAAREIPLSDWLLLRPIPVPEQSFSTIARVDENDVAILTPFEVSNERIGPTQQRNCFNDNWFDSDGAASVMPAAGDKQSVDGNEFTWTPHIAEAGFVELRPSNTKCDYSIGYAWTELTVEKDTDAWLGIGSDDGLKIWLNGELVNDRWIRRSSVLDDEIVAVRLRAGKNRFLLKVQNAIGDWNFIARLRTR